MVESLQGHGMCGLYELLDGKRNVFRAVLKEMTDSVARMCDGSWFHATANERAPKFVTAELMTRSPRVADRSRCLLSTDTAVRLVDTDRRDTTLRVGLRVAL